MKVTPEEFDKQVEIMRARHFVTKIHASDGVYLELYTNPALTEEETREISRLNSHQIKALVGKMVIEQAEEKPPMCPRGD